MDLQKLNVKFFVEPGSTVPLTDFIDIFHSWIQATDGVYHDVADYSHMQAGPGIVLVANDANLAERLAQRQMKVYRAGTAVLELKRQGKDEMSPFLLTASRVHALEAVRGQVGQAGPNELSLPPLNLLGAIGIPLILLAIVLEQVHTRRQRRTAHAYHRPPPVLPSAGG